ncbi:MAG: butyrate kinase [Halanaerobiales bacterium]|nr:butyrate kinase [Halanaerobiales bacterium]
MKEIIFVINPGSTSTKVAVFKGEEEVWQDTIKHSIEELGRFDRIIDQLEWRRELILNAIKKAGFKIGDFDCIVARGGAGLDPIPGGVYKIDEVMVEDLEQGKNAEHASNLAGIIAYRLAKEYHLPALTVDPITVDEFEPVARLSGLPELSRRCQSHALNLKAIARRTAKDLGGKLEEINLIGVHLGGGISVAPLKGGRIVDVNNANQGGPYSPERTGTLPVMDLVDYIYREKPSRDALKKKLVGKGGLTAYLGTNDCQKIEQMIEQGDKKAELAYQGMIYQIAKEIGAMATVLLGEVTAIFITGGLARSEYIVEGIKSRVSFIAPVLVYPGAEEMNHLAWGAIRVLSGKEKVKIYARERLKVGDLDD